MLKKHKKAADDFIKVIDGFYKGGKNVKMYKELFDSMDDDAFEAFVKELDEKGKILPFYYSNLDKERLDINQLFALSESLGIESFQRLIKTDPETGVKVKTAEKYLVLPAMIRRQKQHLMKGISVAKNSKYKSAITGQVMGVSRSSAISLPELFMLDAKGHDAAIKELIKVRGGDEESLREFRRSIIETGEASVDALDDLGSVPTSTESLRSYFFGMMLDSNF